MKVIILCGGRGTRLHEETEFRPKPMVPVGDRPILIHIMESFARFGFKEFVLCLGYKGQVVRDYFLNLRVMNGDVTLNLATGEVEAHEAPIHDWKVTLAETGLSTGTGGRIKRVERHLGREPFFVTYGDGLADVDLGALLTFHNKMGRLATVTGVKPVSRFGVIESRDTGLVERFREKPVLEDRVSGGFFVFQPEILDLFTPDCTLEGEILERMATRGQLALYRHDGCFFSMDTYRDYLQLNEMMDAGQTPWIIDGPLDSTRE